MRLAQRRITLAAFVLLALSLTVPAAGAQIPDPPERTDPTITDAVNVDEPVIDDEPTPPAPPVIDYSWMPDPDDFVIVFPQPQMNSTFADSYGAPRSENRLHMGNDIMGDRGDPVVSIADGRIIKMTTSTRAGYYIAVAHGDGYSSYYIHLNNDASGDDGRGGAATAFAAGLEVGDPVAAGQVIGYVGDSGNAEGTAPHTHFEIRFHNRAVDPYPYLVAAHERWLLEQEIAAGVTPFR